MKRISTTFKTIFCLTLLCLSLQPNVHAQECTIRSTGEVTFEQVDVFQTALQEFTACESGPIKSLMFQLRRDNSDDVTISVSVEEGDLRINDNNDSSAKFEEEDPNDDPAFLGTINLPGGTGQVEDINFTPTNPNALELIAGTTYTLEFEIEGEEPDLPPSGPGFPLFSAPPGPSFGLVNITGDAPEGVGRFFNFSFSPGDLTGKVKAQGRMFNALNFAMVIGNPVAVVAAADPIPTMSEWGLLIFGLLMLNLGVFFVQRTEIA